MYGKDAQNAHKNMLMIKVTKYVCENQAFWVSNNFPNYEQKNFKNNLMIFYRYIVDYLWKKRGWPKKRKKPIIVKDVAIPVIHPFYTNNTAAL